MKKTKLDELLKSGAVTEEEYKDILPTCEDDTGEPDGGEPEPEDPLAGLDEKTRQLSRRCLSRSETGRQTASATQKKRSRTARGCTKS